jgi:hypothetical protein
LSELCSKKLNNEEIFILMKTEKQLRLGPCFAPSNASQVTRVGRIIGGLGLDAATPGEAREILALKGGDWVAF